jgi:4'-phosphopantetheinyl transferase
VCFSSESAPRAFYHEIRGRGIPVPCSAVEPTEPAALQPERGLHKTARQTPRGIGLLRPGMVAVWWMPTDQVGSADCKRWLAILDRDERERADRFRFEWDRRGFIAAHALLRHMLAFHLGRPAEAWQFATSRFGKPAIAESLRVPDIDFNLSHTHDLVAAAVALHAAVGIDVEKIDPAKADFAVAQRYFAPAEIEILRRTPSTEQAVCFFRLWTLKEAYLKATGAGFGTSLDSFAFTLWPIRINFLTCLDDDPRHWHFEMLPTTDAHVLSVAVASHSDQTVHVVSRTVAAQDL